MAFSVFWLFANNDTTPYFLAPFTEFFLQHSALSCTTSFWQILQTVGKLGLSLLYGRNRSASLQRLSATRLSAKFTPIKRATTMHVHGSKEFWCFQFFRKHFRPVSSLSIYFRVSCIKAVLWNPFSGFKYFFQTFYNPKLANRAFSSPTCKTETAL